MKKTHLKKILEEIVKEETFKSNELEGPYTVYVKTGRLAGQIVTVKKKKDTGIYYYLNPDTGHDEPIGTDASVDVYKPKFGGNDYKEGVGYVYAKDRAKDPKSIKIPGGGTEHWRIKFQSGNDLKKHGNTEKTPINENSQDPEWRSGWSAGMNDKENNKTKKTGIGKTENWKRGYNVGWFQSSRHSQKSNWGIWSKKENIKHGELKEMIRELVNEMWVGWEQEEQKQRTAMDNEKESVNENSDWNPQPLQKNKDFISNLIFSLKEGTEIVFIGGGNLRSPSIWETIQKVASGDELIYKTYGNGGEKYDLEMDEDIEEFAKNIADYKHITHYNIQSVVGPEGQPYKKKPYEGEPDHDIGDYERFGPDPVRWQDVSESKNMNKKQLVKLIKESVQEIQHGEQYKEEDEIRALKYIQSIVNQMLKSSHLDGGLSKGVLSIQKVINWLVSIHEKSQEVPTDTTKKTPLGVTQETITKTKNVLDQMISQRKRK